MAAWLKFQDRNVLNFRYNSARPLGGLDQAYRLYTLALDNNSDPGAMNRLKEQDGLCPQARWMLASAYSLCGKKSVAESLLSYEDIEVTDNQYYGSPLRDRAIEVEALSLAGKAGEALKAARPIAEEWNKGNFSTQEIAFASIAMNRLASISNTGALSMDIGGKAVNSAKAIYVQNLGGNSTALKNNSAGPVSVRISSKEKAAARSKVEASASGLGLDVKYVALDGTPVNPSSIKQGSDFEAVITVTSKTLDEDYGSLALTMSLPSGWEISNDRMAGRVAAAQDSFTYNDIRDDSDSWFFDLPRGLSKKFTVRLRAAYEGSFTLPPVTCVAMYDSSVHANTASGEAVVTR
jgi:uncharacterized protein YfaS (alpha-2-macroglobulin family)